MSKRTDRIAARSIIANVPRFRVPSLPKILVHGDLRKFLKDKHDIADLVYFDPPFGTGRDFGAYGDASRDLSVDDYFVPRVEIDPILKFATDEISRVWLAYLASCLLPIRQATKRSGSFWIHIDERYSHLARLLCDRLLAPAKWRSTIVWAYRRWPSKSRRFQSFHDVLFHYAPEDGAFNVLYDELSASSIAKWGRNKKVKAMVDGRITSVSTDEARKYASQMIERADEIDKRKATESGIDTGNILPSR